MYVYSYSYVYCLCKYVYICKYYEYVLVLIDPNTLLKSFGAKCVSLLHNLRTSIITSL